MKYILPAFALMALALPASAEPVRPPNFTTESNNTATGNKVYETREMAGPNRVYSREEYNEMQEERRNKSTSWLTSGEKPTITRNGTTTHLKKVLSRKASNAADSAISDAFNE